MILGKIMKLHDTDDVKPGNICDHTRIAKTGVNILGFLSKF